ncbi:STM3941 family protein [Chryseobacterium gallinarum]|uniref:Uncharacterized protein n=1 Tax=Chryseobacterium gallinarum TaxID=1324352 RepID=A0ABX6KR08_CHRGL|nr:STM3941 family protein [Chryseobacterium gallinarum]QIY90536.1 hypothetical protein FOB44_07600 [Chryseobacterium gallinarum]
MSDIIFKKSKPKYLFFILILLVIIISVLYFGILWVKNPSKYIFWLMPSKIIVFFVGSLAILSSIILIYFLIKSIFNKKFFIEINEKGLFLGIIQYSNKLIYWEDITHIESVKINGVNHILIFVKNIEHYKNKEKGIQKYFFTSTSKKYGTPFVINVNALSDKFENIVETIIITWEKCKK